MATMYFCATTPSSAMRPRNWRFRLDALGLLRCFLPAWARISFPLAETRNRLREPLCVFIFGMAPSPQPPPRRRGDNERGTKKTTLLDSVEESFVLYNSFPQW